ncbi:MAG: PP2C family protein-serine/threonine phosphatase [Thermodesulfobacteriota bacterium]
MIVDAYTITDVGLRRELNEDAVYLDPDRELIMVLDGMGGHQAGEVASRIAMETMASFYKEHAHEPARTTDIFEAYDECFTYHTNLLRQAALAANRAVLVKSLERDERLGMGSTVAGIAIHGYTVSAINVGDSRLYLIRDGSIEQISRDHTLAEDQFARGILTREELRDSQLKHILSSVLGVDDEVRVHMEELFVLPGDIVLLCTDGLYGVLEDAEMLGMIQQSPVGPETLSRLVDEVNARGGPDNTTVALAVFRRDSDSVEE